jgi:hypothetical protein
MPDPLIRPFRGNQLSIPAVNRLARVARQSQKLGVVGGTLIQDSTGTTICPPLPAESIWAQLTERGTDPTGQTGLHPYSWVQVTPHGNGSWDPVVNQVTQQPFGGGPDTGNAAYQLDNYPVTPGQVVKLWQGAGGEYLFTGTDESFWALITAVDASEKPYKYSWQRLDPAPQPIPANGSLWTEADPKDIRAGIPVSGEPATSTEGYEIGDHLIFKGAWVIMWPADDGTFRFMRPPPDFSGASAQVANQSIAKSQLTALNSWAVDQYDTDSYVKPTTGQVISTAPGGPSTPAPQGALGFTLPFTGVYNFSATLTWLLVGTQAKPSGIRRACVTYTSANTGNVAVMAQQDTLAGVVNANLNPSQVYSAYQQDPSAVWSPSANDNLNQSIAWQFAGTAGDVIGLEVLSTDATYNNEVQGFAAIEFLGPANVTQGALLTTGSTGVLTGSPPGTSVFSTGFSGTVTLVSSITCNNGVMAFSVRDLVFTNGQLASVSSEHS